MDSHLLASKRSQLSTLGVLASIFTPTDRLCLHTARAGSDSRVEGVEDESAGKRRATQRPVNRFVFPACTSNTPK